MAGRDGLKLVGISVVVVGAALGWLLVRRDRVPGPARGEAAARRSGGRTRSAGDGFAGCGWSTHPSTSVAVREAMDASTGPGGAGPDLTLVFYTTHHDPSAVVKALAEDGGRLCGWSTHQGVLTPDGFQSSDHGAVGVLSFRLPGVRVGVGGAAFEEASSPKGAAALAAQRAVRDAGSNLRAGPPDMIVLSSTIGHEEEVLAGLAEAVGPVPVVGGSAAGSLDWINRESVSNWSVVAGDRVISNGLTLVVLYSDEPFGWAYNGGYDLTSKCGVITACEKRLIREIDGRNAAAVYDEWLGGRLANVEQTDVHLLTFCALYPLSRSVSLGEASHRQFVHVWPGVSPETRGSLIAASDVAEGDRVRLSEGTWDILLNRFSELPDLARRHRPDLSASAALLVCCGCILDNIPDRDRDQMAFLLDRSLGDVPWLAMFTWGEQGNVPGLGNFHGNLTTGALVLPGPDGGDD